MAAVPHDRLQHGPAAERTVLQQADSDAMIVRRCAGAGIGNHIAYVLVVEAAGQVMMNPTLWFAPTNAQVNLWRAEAGLDISRCQIRSRVQLANRRRLSQNDIVVSRTLPEQHRERFMTVAE